SFSRDWSSDVCSSDLAPEAPVVVIGSLNADPADGDGLRVAVQRLLAHDRLQDPQPASAGGPAAAVRQGGVNDHHLGDPALDTAEIGRASCRGRPAAYV